ncbi:hypothetical protein ACNJ69_12185 [Acinetobacter soli]|uniref:hypothetical protein n=1 Tax=Acinetobacter soli TaxID=487316 RepID=UPI001F40D145|nr:hypothetical protein [Acinetobacter soli]MCE6007599.1 hypothetical protein [Acinetobacter soli]
MNAHKFVAEHGVKQAKSILEKAPETATHFTEALGGHYSKEVMLKMRPQWAWFNTINKEWYYDFAAKEHIELAELKQVVESLDMVAKHGGLFYLKSQIEKGGYDFEWYGENGEFGFTDLNVLEKAIADYELVESYKQVKCEVLDMVDVSPRCEVRNG